MTATESVAFQYVSLVKGRIPTRPAPQTPDEVLQECQYYYEMSYNGGGTSTPLGGTGPGSLTFWQKTDVTGGNTAGYSSNFSFRFNTVKRTTTPTVSLYGYSSTINSVSVRSYNGGTATSPGTVSLGGFWAIEDVGSKGVHYVPGGSTPATAFITTAGTSTSSSAAILFHYVVDARIGVVV